MSDPPLRFPKTAAVLVGLSYMLFFFWACVAVPELSKQASRALGAGEEVRSAMTGLGWLAVAAAVALALRYLSGQTRRAWVVLVLVLLPAWGLVLNGMMAGECQRECPDPPYRALAMPEVFGLYALHAASVLGYAISRRRAEDLPARSAPWVVALLLCGLVLHAAITVQFAGLVQYLLLLPFTLPLLTPVFSLILFWRELSRRLRHTAAQSAAPPELGGGLLRAPLLLGAHALIQALWRGHPTGALDAFARTCTHPLSALPLELARDHCGHYLCTVAACGHPWLVRPERLGERRGRVVVVNRQLAIANAFEELLHVRWPRFGRLARGSYDRLAVPVCRFIQRRWLADVVYVAMKPAEGLFYAALLLLDRSSPETRIERQYRATDKSTGAGISPA